MGFTPIVKRTGLSLEAYIIENKTPFGTDSHIVDSFLKALVLIDFLIKEGIAAGDGSTIRLIKKFNTEIDWSVSRRKYLHEINERSFKNEKINPEEPIRYPKDYNKNIEKNYPLTANQVFQRYKIEEIIDKMKAENNYKKRQKLAEHLRDIMAGHY